MDTTYSDYKIDIAFVVDMSCCTDDFKRMLKGCVGGIKKLFAEEFAKKDRRVGQMRIRFISFGDYETELDGALIQTDYFYADDTASLFKAIDGLECKEREKCKNTENALEALYAAIVSDWVEIKPKERGRHIIILLTDSYPLRLLERKECAGYPPEDEIPPDIMELQCVWDDDSGYLKLSPKSKRLVVFAPSGDDGAGHKWDDVLAWAQTVYIEVERGNRLAEADLLTELEQMFM